MNKIKTLIFIFLIFILLIGCSDSITSDFYELKPPIILIAESKTESVILKDKDDKYLFISERYYLANTISQSYEVGDTLK